MEYANEIGTIRCYCGRQLGSTYFINETATINDLIIVLNDKTKDEFLNNKAKCITISEYKILNKDNIYNNIFIDDPTFVFYKIPKDTIYMDLFKDETQTIYLLGI